LAESSQTYLPLHKVAAVGIGNALAFYDFLSFSFFAIQIGHSFFPRSTGGNSLLYALATFGTGFLTRPLGGWLIGMYGDRAGRKPAMLLSFGLMGFAILGMALTPSYSVIGIAAPVLLVIFRMLQGLALGGEVGPSTAFLIEAAPPARRGLYVALQWATQDFAVLVAGVVGEVLARALSPAALDAWGWRLAFLAGAAVVPLGLFMRRALPETFHQAASAAAHAAPARPAPSLLLIGFAVLAVIGVGNYVLVYMSTYGQDTLGLAAGAAFFATIICGALQCCSDLASGIASDRFGRKPVLLVSMGLLCLLTLPCFIAMAHFRSAASLYGATAVMSLLVSGMCGPALVSLTEALPAAQRSGIVSIIYAIAMSVFGGTTQFLLKYLTDLTGNKLAPAWYFTAVLAVGLLAAMFLRETAPARERRNTH